MDQNASGRLQGNTLAPPRPRRTGYKLHVKLVTRSLRSTCKMIRILRGVPSEPGPKLKNPSYTWVSNALVTVLLPVNANDSPLSVETTPQESPQSRKRSPTWKLSEPAWKRKIDLIGRWVLRGCGRCLSFMRSSNHWCLWRSRSQLRRSCRSWRTSIPSSNVS